MFLCTLPGFKSSGGKSRLTLAEFDVLLREFILDTYHERLHGETDVAPIRRWEKGGFLPRMPETLEQLDLLLLTVPTAPKVHPDGILFQGLRYIDTTLAAYIGESVMLRYDPRDAAEVRIFYNDRFLCRAVCPELAGAVITLRDVLKARRQRRRGLFAAKKRGVRFAQPRKLALDQGELAHRLVSEGKSVREVASVFNVHPATIYRLAAVQRGGMASSVNSAV